MKTFRYPTSEINIPDLPRHDTAEDRVYFLGLHFNTGSMKEASRDILAQTNGHFRYVATPNVHHMVKLLEDPVTMRPLYQGAWRVFCDSRVLSRLARVSGLRVPVITGSDLTVDLITHAVKQGLPIAVLGPTDAACARLKDKYPGLDVVSYAPPMGFIRSELEIRKCVDFVVKARAPLIFIAVGRPQQEILAGRIADHPQARGVGLCIGASIDFLTGTQRRAPVWIQNAGLEWLYRLISDPQRFARRYLLESPWIFYFVWLELKENLPSLKLGGKRKTDLRARDKHPWSEVFARRRIPRHVAEFESDLTRGTTAKASNIP